MALPLCEVQTANARRRIASQLFCLIEQSPKTPLKHYSYFLVRPEGNILFHPFKKTSVLKQHEAWFAEHGGVRLQVLTHDAEASASCDWIHARFGAGLYLHGSDAPHIARKTRCPIACAFSSGHRVCDGLEAIPLTGHTLGFTAYKLSTGEATFLLTGDFLTLNHEKWTARVYKLLMPVGIANLNAVKDIAFDSILPNMSRGTATPPFRLTAVERAPAIDGAVARLMRTDRSRR